MFKQTAEKVNYINDQIQELLKEQNVDTSLLQIDSNLSETQKRAFEAFKRGESLLILGPGGVGKSLLIKTMETYHKTTDPNPDIAMCATTGVAAYNISGMTIHSFMGMGDGSKDLPTILRRISRNKAVLNRIKMVKILIIDEISMMSAEIFEKVHCIFQHFRRNRNAFFGGIQVVLSGDLLQNEPVFKTETDTRLLIESDLFNQTFIKNRFVLTTNFRQQRDTAFLNLLNRIRENKYDNFDIQTLETKCRNFKTELDQKTKRGIVPVHLVSSNKRAQIINESNLKRIAGQEYLYNAEITKNIKNAESDMMERELKFQFEQKGLINLKLKRGTRVMLIKNLDVAKGLVNGSVGTITEFSNEHFPIVSFDNGVKQKIEPIDWELELNTSRVKMTQLPLILAYALTIHKSQSLTLDHAILDLEECFCNHLVYSALSRLKTFDGMLLKSFDQKKITVNQKILSWLTTF